MEGLAAGLMVLVVGNGGGGSDCAKFYQMPPRCKTDPTALFFALALFLDCLLLLLLPCSWIDLCSKTMYLI